MTAAGALVPGGEAKVLHENGGWQWFMSPRALVWNDTLVFGSVSGCHARGYTAGDVSVTVVPVGPSGTSATSVVAPALLANDHISPVVHIRPDGVGVVAYASHDSNAFFTRFTHGPGNFSRWSEPVTHAAEGLAFLSIQPDPNEAGKVYLFHRRQRLFPGYAITTSELGHFQGFTRWMKWTWPSPEQDPKSAIKVGSGRPYVIFASNGRDRIDFIATEDHPRNYATSVYHGYLQKGMVYRSEGALIAPLSEEDQFGVQPTDLTRVFQGSPDAISFLSGLTHDKEGRPVVAFSVRKGNANDRLNPQTRGVAYHYGMGRWDGSQWRVYEVADAGTCLYSPEVDYTGLMAVDPADPDFVVISTSRSPLTGRHLTGPDGRSPRWELFSGISSDRGKTWKWSPLRANAAESCIRPIVLDAGRGRRVILWMQGTYTTTRNFDTRIKGMLQNR